MTNTMQERAAKVQLTLQKRREIWRRVEGWIATCQRTPTPVEIVHVAMSEVCALELSPDPTRAALEECVRALTWALPLAELAMESHRVERIRCGHMDITGKYKSGETWVGIYQDEVDKIENARAVLATARNALQGE